MFKEKLTEIESKSAENSGSQYREGERAARLLRKKIDFKDEKRIEGPSVLLGALNERESSKSKIYSRVFLLILRMLVNYINHLGVGIK